MDLEGGAGFLESTFHFSYDGEREGATRTFYICNAFYMTIGY